MADQYDLARKIISALRQSGLISEVALSGSLARGQYDELSDVDIDVADPLYPPWENVQRAVSIIETQFGILLQEWASSLMPEKYLVSAFLPGQPIWWWVDIGAFPNPAHDEITREDVPQDDNLHLAKLFIMNAKHFLRGTTSRLHIDTVYVRLRDDGDNVDQKQKFATVFHSVDFSKLPDEIRLGANSIMAMIDAK